MATKKAKATKATKAKASDGRPDLANRLLKWREWRGIQLGRKMTQEEAAAELGLPTGSYINYEHDHRYPRQQIMLDHLWAKTEIPSNGKRQKKTPAAVAVGS